MVKVHVLARHLLEKTAANRQKGEIGDVPRFGVNRITEKRGRSIGWVI